MEVLSKKASHQIVSPRDLRPEVPLPLERAVLWALAFDPAERPQSMGELSYELTKLSTGRATAVASVLGITGKFSTLPATTAPSIKGSEPVIELPPTPATANKSRWIALGAAVASVALLLVALLFIRLWTAERGAEPAVNEAAQRPASDRADSVTRPPLPTKGHGASPARPSRGAPPSPSAGEGRLLEIGYERLQDGQFAQARRAFEKARRSPRTRARALGGLAELAFQRGDFLAARRYAERSIAAGGRLRAELILGNALFKLGEHTRAIELYRRVLARDPNQAEARRNLEAAQRLLHQ
jgi:tetratricopeptide (TPR) repeat protein